MTMHNPPHPGEILKEDILVPLDLTVTEASRRLGVSRKTLSKLINQHGALMPEMAVRLEKAFSPSAEHWLRLQAAHDLWQTRRELKSIRIQRIAHT
jgi:antitoxin HigA-1